MADEAIPSGEGQTERSETLLNIISQISSDGQRQLASLAEVPLSIEIRIGQVTVPLAELLAMQAGSVLTLDRGLDELVEVLVAGKVIAYGEIVAVGDQLGVRILEVAISEDSPVE